MELFDTMIEIQLNLTYQTQLLDTKSTPRNSPFQADNSPLKFNMACSGSNGGGSRLGAEAVSLS